METQDRLRANAAMDQLALCDEAAWIEPARTLIEYAHTLPRSSRTQVMGNFTSTSKGESISGQTPHGQVTIKDKDEKKEREFSLGINKERVGNYRLWRSALGSICFHHYAHSSLSTQGLREKPDTSWLGFNEETLEPQWFGIQEEKVLLDLLFMVLKKTSVRVLFRMKK